MFGEEVGRKRICSCLGFILFGSFFPLCVPEEAVFGEEAFQKVTFSSSSWLEHVMCVAS